MILEKHPKSCGSNTFEVEDMRTAHAYSGFEVGTAQCAESRNRRVGIQGDEIKATKLISSISRITTVLAAFCKSPPTTVQPRPLKAETMLSSKCLVANHCGFRWSCLSHNWMRKADKMNSRLPSLAV